jgi:LEA14-like dessication related protein
MDLKRVGKWLLVGIVALVALVAVLVVLGVLGIPSAELEDNSWGEVGEERIEVITTITVDNPNPFGIGGEADVEYEITLQGVQLAEGEGNGVEIDSGENELQFRTDILYQRSPAWWSAHLNNDEVSDLRVDATVHTSVGPLSGSPSGTYEDEVDTDIEGALDEGFSEFEGEYSASRQGITAPDGTAIEPTVEIENATTRWGEVTENRTEIVLTLQIHNPNAYPLPTPAFTGEFEMNNITMADWDAGEERLTVNISLNFRDFEVQYFPQKEDGTLDTAVRFGMSIPRNAVTSG